MNLRYKEYLSGEHWRTLRRNILETRAGCQNCGVKKRLNIHHKHYRTVGKESNEDLVVLCQDCHLRFHKKPKWEKKKRNREEMDFLRTKAKKSKLYTASEILRDCRRCGEKHPVFYKKYSNSYDRLCMACPNSKPRVMAIKYEGGLDIPTFKSKSYQHL